MQLIGSAGLVEVSAELLELDGVLVGNSAIGLTCAFGADTISTRVRLAGLPPAYHGAGLANFAGLFLGVEGRGDTRFTPGGRGLAPSEPETQDYLV